MSKQKFEKWVTDGPEAGSLEDTKAALAWRDANPAEAFAVQREYEAHRLLEERRELLVETARRQGATRTEAARLAERLMAEEREADFRTADENARRADAIRLRGGF